MQVYKVSPVVKYSPFFLLTYVSKEKFVCGDLVPINFNNREILGIVVEVYDLKNARVEIRKANFHTKKITGRFDSKIEKFLSRDFFDIYKQFACDNGISLGEIFFFIYGETPSLKKVEKVEQKVLAWYPDDLTFKVSQKEKCILKVKGKDFLEKFLKYDFEEFIIKDFNFDRFLNFQAPHISQLDLWFAMLEKFNFGKVFKITLETSFLGVVEKNFLDENLIDGKLFGKFEIDIRERINVAKKYVVKVGRDKNGEEEILPSETIEKIFELNKKIFLFVLSHGFADRIFCNDCKKSYECESCGHAYSLLTEEGERFLFCKKCKHKKELQKDQYVICKNCGSWRIFPFGLGGQRVKDFLDSHQVQSVLIDESQKKFSAKKFKEAIQSFGNNGVLIGSVRTLKILNEVGSNFDKSVIVSTGPLVRGTFFDSDERFLRLISQVENISNEVYLCRREGDETALENYKDKDKFIREETIFRKNSDLPPQKKVLSVIFTSRNKRLLDKFLMQNFEKYQKVGEIKRGNTYVYFWFIPRTVRGEMRQFLETLRQFGDVVVANSVVEQSVLGKK